MKTLREEAALAAGAPTRPRWLRAGSPNGPQGWMLCALAQLERRAPVFVTLEPFAGEQTLELLEGTAIARLRMNKHPDARLLDQVHTARLRAASTVGLTTAARARLGVPASDAPNALWLVESLSHMARGGWVLFGRETAAAFGLQHRAGAWTRDPRQCTPGSAAFRITRRCNAEICWVDLQRDGEFVASEREVLVLAQKHVVFDRAVGQFRDLVQ